jgi:hypothetical protein
MCRELINETTDYGVSTPDGGLLISLGPRK